MKNGRGGRRGDDDGDPPGRGPLQCNAAVINDSNHKRATQRGAFFYALGHCRSVLFESDLLGKSIVQSGQLAEILSFLAALPGNSPIQIFANPVSVFGSRIFPQSNAHQFFQVGSPTIVRGVRRQKFWSGCSFFQ